MRGALWSAILTGSFVLGACAGGEWDAAGTDSAQTAQEAEPCAGACGAVEFNACTCAAEDPCGWAGDGYCDRDCSPFQAHQEIFDDGEDCPDCAVTMCLSGAIKPGDSGNTSIRDFCEDPRLPGVIPDCRSGRCSATFANFMHSPRKDLLPELIDALDTNGDGRVGDDDLACEVNLVGFSWGGVNAVRLAREFRNSDRVSASRTRVHRLLVMDAYQPLRSGLMKVPPNVWKARSYRHSIPREGACSASAPFGPYSGWPLLCDDWQNCRDYDYSLAPDRWFDSPIGWYRGRDVDHCAVPRVAHEPAMAELHDEPYDGPLPPLAH